MREAVVVASSRTALAKSYRGSFNMTRPDDLAAHCINDVLRKTPQLDPAEIGDVILGCAQPHGAQGINIARVASLLAGLPVSVAGTTVNRFCSSGLQAIAMAAHQILQEGADAAIGGGVESISLTAAQTPIRIPSCSRSISPGFTWSWATPRKWSPSATRSAGRRRTNIRCSASSAPLARSRKASFAGEIAPMKVTRAVLDKKTGEVAPAPKKSARTRTNATGPTPRSKACWH